MNQVEILEVAPRDGFQAVKPFIATETKIAIIEQLAACGFKRLEIGSFVSPKAIPQLADTGEILRRVRLPKGLRIQVLVPNAKGLEMALEAGVREIVWVISVSESHNRANVNRSVDESFRSCGWRSRPASTAPGRAASPRTASSAWSSVPSRPPLRSRSRFATPRAAPRPITSARCSAG
jgi:hydroxymethylglutaryl-CoA lyase